MATPTDPNLNAPATRDTLVARLALLMDDTLAAAERSAAEAELAGTAEGQQLLEAWRSLDSPPAAPQVPDLVPSIMRQLPAQSVHGSQVQGSVEPVQRTRFAGWTSELRGMLSRPRIGYALAFAGLLAIALLVVTGLPALAPGGASGAAHGAADRGWVMVAGTGLAAAIAALWLWRRRS